MSWRRLNSCDSTFPSIVRPFPYRVKSHPKKRQGEKLSTAKTTEGARCSYTLGRTLIPFSLKVFGILKTFFQKSFKQVRTASATFGCGQSPRPCGAGRVAVPDGLRQYHPVCRRDFPMQGEVAPKEKKERKNFHPLNVMGRNLFALPSVGRLFLFVESFWNS